MKVDKRITKCLIGATALIVIVATTPVLSGFALAQQPTDANLTIENVVRANCP
jgi:hypothetical protein